MDSLSKSFPRLALFRGPEASGTFSWSPFVTKLEARLRFAGVPYSTERSSPKSAPRGKIPYIEIKPGDRSPPTSLSDSNLIIEKLIDDGVLDDINKDLSPTERAHDLALRALLEDKLYWYNGVEKWNDNYYEMRSYALGALPWPMQVVIGFLIRRNNLQTFYSQGVGRFTDEERRACKKQILGNINVLLVDAKQKAASSEVPFWVMGSRGPSETDAVVFGFICSMLVVKAGPETQKIVKGYPVIVEYAERIYKQYFPDYVRWE